jgi:hypothetical protein
MRRAIKLGIRRVVTGIVMVCPMVTSPVPARAQEAATAGRIQTAPTKSTEIPRAPDGKPNLQGYWRRTVIASSIEDFPGDVLFRPQKSLIVDPPDGRLPYRPGMRELSQEISQKYFDPNALCFLLGVPRFMYQSDYQFLQTPDYITIQASEAHAYRIIPMDGRPHIGSSIKQLQGDSRGHWEGDTLVIDVTNQDEERLDIYTGNFTSDAVHVVERYTPVDADTIRYEVTVEDPNVYTAPWKMATRFVRNKENGYQILEEACHEGNHELKEMQNQFSVYPGLEALKKKPQ